MLNIDLQYVVSTFAPIMLKDTWKQWVDRKTKKSAAYFKFKCHFSYYEGNDGTESNFVLHIIVTQNHEVFYAVNNSYTANTYEFIFSSAHDSCWRSMDFLTQLYFEYCKKTNPNVAPVNIRQSNFIMSEPKIISVLTESENMSDSYKKMLVSIG